MDWQLGGIGLYAPDAMAEMYQLGGGMPGMGMGMNPSLSFGGMMDPLLSFGGGAGLGLMPGMYGMQDPQKAFDYMQKRNEFGYKMQDMGLENRERLYYNQNSSQNRIKSAEGVVINGANNLKRTIEDNKASQVITKFNEFKGLLSSLPTYRGVSSEQLTAEAKMIFEKRYGISIENAVSESCSDSLVAGIKTGMSFGTYSKPSSEAIVAQLTDTNVDSIDKFKEFTGTVAGSAGMAAGVTGLVTRGLGKTKIGLALGAVAGALIGSYKWATSPLIKLQAQPKLKAL